MLTAVDVTSFNSQYLLIMSMSLGHFILEICSNVWSFLSDRAHKEFLYLFKKGERTSVGDAERGNAYVNEIVEHFITEGAHEYDPYIFEDKIYTLLRIPAIVEVEHLETFVEGLISLHNENSCKLTEKCGQLYVTTNLGAGPLHFTMFAWGKLFHIEQLITIAASVNHCKVNGYFSLDAETGRNGRLHSLSIEEFTDVKICIAITGFGYLSWFLSKFFTLITIFNYEMVRNLVEFELERYVRKLFPVFQFPIEGRNIKYFSEDRSALDQGEENSLKCSNTIMCERSSFNNDSTMSTAVSREAAKSSSMEREKQIMADTIIHNIVDCNKEVDSKNIQFKEKHIEDSEVASDLKRDAWFTNITLLQGYEMSSHESESTNNDNIQIDFKFSKDEIILEDVEPLARLDLTTCCVFVKYETENLQKMMSKEINYLPSKHYKRFFKSLLSPNEESEVGEISKRSEQLPEPFLSEEKIPTNKRSLKSLFEEYPNFIALTYNRYEEQKLEGLGPNFESNGSTEVKQSESNSEITLENDKINISLPAESHSITYNPKTEVFKCSELINTQVLCAVQAETRDTAIDRLNNVESILRWTCDSENTDESICYNTKKYQSQSLISKPYIQSDCSTFTKCLDKQSKKSNVKKESSKNKKIKGKLSRSTKMNLSRTEKNVKKENLKNTTSLRGENVNESKLKTTCTSIEKLNVIVDAICRHFENPWLVTIPESNFFFEDNESGTFSHLTGVNKLTSELAEQPGLLEDTKTKRLSEEDEDRAIDLRHILKKAENFIITPNKYRQSAALNSCVQDAAANLDACTISQVVKNFFEQNPIDKMLLRQNIPLTICDMNENELNFSFSSNVDFSGALKDKLFDLVPDTYKESSDVFEVEKFNLVPQDPNNRTEMTEVNVKQYTHDTVDLINDLLYWSDPGSVSSNSDMLNVSSDNSANYQDLTKRDFFENFESAPKIDYMKNETHADVSSCEIMSVDNELLLKCDDGRVCETFDRSQSTTSNQNFDKQLKINSKILKIEDKDLYSPSNKTLNVAKVKQAVLNEDIKAELEETDKTSSQIELVDILKETKEGNEYDNKLNFRLANVDGQHEKNSLESILVFEETYDRIHADILLLLKEDSQDVGFEIEDCALEMTGQLFPLRIDTEESRMSYNEVTEEFQLRTDSIQYRQESLFDNCCVGTLDNFNKIEDEELEYINEQAKRLEVMFKYFAQHRDACEINTFTESSHPYRESTWRDIYGRLVEHEDTHEHLRKDKESFVNVQWESYGCISSDKSIQDNRSPLKECVELVNVEEKGRLLEDIGDPKMYSETKDNKPLVENQDTSYGWISSEQSVQGQRSPWEECKIVDGEGRVPWKRAMQIWGLGTNTLF